MNEGAMFRSGSKERKKERKKEKTVDSTGIG
jgi:hypothetical protein